VKDDCGTPLKYAKSHARQFGKICPFGMKLNMETAILVSRPKHFASLEGYRLFYRLGLSPRCIHCGVVSAPGYRGEACQHLDLDLVDLKVKGHFRIRKVQPEV
jgi:hypothetical protein